MQTDRFQRVFAMESCWVGARSAVVDKICNLLRMRNPCGGAWFKSMAENISSKVVEYERFLNERLRADLRSVLERRDAVYNDKAEYTQLKATIQHLINEQSSPQKKESLKTMVDLGCNFYAKARVQDYSRIIVAIGLGFYLEMQLDEAVTFIDKKVAVLTKEAEQLSEQASQINARIKMVLGALHELQFRPDSGSEQVPPPRSVW